MRDFGPLGSALCAGALSSLCTLLVFLVVHHVWIKPIWMIAPPGAVIAVVGGLLIGWSWRCVEEALPRGPMGAVALFALVLGVLLPGILLSFTHGPLFDLATAQIPAGQGWAVAIRVTLELLLTSLLVGAAAGWWLGRSWQAALSTALAGLAFAMGPGHNVPMFGTTLAPAAKGIAILVMLVAALSVSFVAILAWLRDRSS